jgi:hypothetical protein
MMMTPAIAIAGLLAMAPLQLPPSLQLEGALQKNPGLFSSPDPLLQPRLHLELNRWLALDLAISATGLPQATPRAQPEPWRLAGSLAISRTITKALTFNLSAGGYLDLPNTTQPVRDRGVSFGAVPSLGVRTLPLLEYHLRPGLTLELGVSASHSFALSRWTYCGLLGLTWVF